MMEETKFLDFHVIVNKISGDKDKRYITAIADAPVSRYNSPFNWLGDLHNSLQMFPLPGSRSANLVSETDGKYHLEQRGGINALSQDDMIEIGQELFQVLFPDGSSAYELLWESCQCAINEKAVLRIKLELHSDLSNLPWETILCPLTTHKAQVIRPAKKCIVRYLGDIYGPIKNMNKWQASGDRPCILIIKADPVETRSKYPQVSKSLNSELNRLTNILKDLSDGIIVEIIQDEDTLGKIYQAVEKHEKKNNPIIGLHIMGHGGVDNKGGFYLGENNELKQEKIYVDNLIKKLESADSIEWVILNACSTAVEPIGCPLAGLATSMAVLKGVPTVIAFKRPIDTTDAEALAVSFYEEVIKKGAKIDDIIRSIQNKYNYPGGLVILERSVEGKLKEYIKLRNILDTEIGESTCDENIRAETEPPKKERVRRARPAEIKHSEMKLIPAGPFTKGLTPQQLDSVINDLRKAEVLLDFDEARKYLSEEAQETTNLPDFYIGKMLVTNAQFKEFVEATGYITDAEKDSNPLNWRTNNIPDKADHPVVNVSFNDAEAYCRWAGVRLPKVNEWKKAYRGKNNNIYPWGSHFDENKCNTAESCRGWETTPVDKFTNGASPYGCLDMVGNVEEWTGSSDEYGRKIILGGSWAMSCQLFGLPVIQRLGEPNYYSNDLGFRCASDQEIK